MIASRVTSRLLRQGTLSFAITSALVIVGACAGKTELSSSSSSGDADGSTNATGTGTPADGASSTAVGDVATSDIDKANAPGPGDASASDPHEVRCAAEVCSTPGQACCLESGPSAKDVCVAANGATCSASMKRECDEAADCPASQNCCELGHVAPFHIRATICVAQCDPQGGAPAICKTDAECAPQACVFVQCAGEVVGFCGGSPAPGWCGS